MEEKCKDFYLSPQSDENTQLKSHAKELKRQKWNKMQTEDQLMDALDEVETKVYGDDADLGPRYLDLSYQDPEILEAYAELPLVSKNYYDFERFNEDQEILLVIGGETEGISPSAVKFCHHHLGERLCVPLRRKTVESLNVVSATSVILFEIQRKLSQAVIRSKGVDE